MNQEINQQLLYEQTNKQSKIEVNIVKQDNLQDLFLQTKNHIDEKDNQEKHELNTKQSQIQYQVQQKSLEHSYKVSEKSLPQSQKSLFKLESDKQSNYQQSSQQKQEKSQEQQINFEYQVENLGNQQIYQQDVELNQKQETQQQGNQWINKKQINNLSNSILQLKQLKYDELEEQKIINLVDEKYELKKNSNKKFLLYSLQSNESDGQNLNLKSDEVNNIVQIKQKFQKMKQFVKNSQEQKAKYEKELEQKFQEQNSQKFQEVEKFYQDKIEDLKKELQQLLYKQQMDLQQQMVPDLDQYNEYIKVKSNEYDDMIKILQNLSDNSKQSIIIQQNQRMSEQNLLRAVYEKQFQNYQDQFEHLYDMTKKFVKENIDLHLTIQNLEKQQQDYLKQIQELKFTIEQSIDQLQQKEYQLKSKSIELEDLIEKCQFENQMLKEIKSQGNLYSNIQTDNIIEYYNNNGVNKILNQKEQRQQNQYENERIINLEQQLKKAAAIIGFFNIELENYKNVYNMFGPQNKSMNMNISKQVSDQFNQINKLKNQISKRQVKYKESNKNKRLSQINMVNQKLSDVLHEEKLPIPKQGLPQINDHHQQNKYINLEQKFRNKSTDVVSIFPNNLINQSMALIQNLYGANDKQDKYKKLSQKINNSLIIM